MPLLTLNPEGKLLAQPSAAVHAANGEYYVLDGANHRIQVFEKTGAFSRTLGEDAGLRNPLGLAIDAGGKRLFVADSGNGRIVVLGLDGRIRSTLGLPAKETANPPDPTDVSLDEARNRLYVVDNENHRLLVYTLDSFKLLSSIGAMEVVGEGFRWPFSLATHSKGTVYMVDVINTVVRSFDADQAMAPGVNLGGWGVAKGEFYRPKGVAVDRSGRIFVSDSYLGVVQIFLPSGEFHSVLGDRAGKIWRFDNPVRLSIDDQGRLLVVEMAANRVGIYKVED